MSQPALVKTAPAASAPVAQRQAHYDHIRVFLTVMVVMVHAAITYGAIGGWYMQEITTDKLPEWLQLGYVTFNAGNQSYFMGMFFLLAGYFTLPSLERKGPRRFIMERLRRLGIPLLAWVLVLHQISASLAYMAGGGSFWGAMKWMYTHLELGNGPLWFAQALLIFTGLYLLWRLFRPAPAGEAPLPGHGRLLLAAVVTGLAAFAIRQWVPVGVSIAGMQFGFFSSYIGLFYTGCLASRHNWLERVDLKLAWPWMLVSVVNIPVLWVIFYMAQGAVEVVVGGWHWQCLAYAMWEPFEAWGIILGLLWLTRRHLSGSTAFTRLLGRSCYAAYCIHAPILIGLTILAAGWQGDAHIKWLTIGSMTTALSFALGALLVRIPGVRAVL